MDKENKNNKSLFQEFKQLNSVHDKVKFLHKHFWANMKLNEKNFRLNCDAVLCRSPLALDILSEALEQGSMQIAYEIDLIISCFIQSDSENAKQAIKDYNEVIEKMAPHKFIEALRI